MMTSGQQRLIGTDIGINTSCGVVRYRVFGWTESGAGAGKTTAGLGSGWQEYHFGDASRLGRFFWITALTHIDSPEIP